MKAYEARTDISLMPLLPTLARVDGRAFHSFTRKLGRPYDSRLAKAMEETAKLLAEETQARVAYTQSDEITLAWHSTNPKSEIWFAGRHSKMVSQLGALATLYFYRACLKHLPEEYSEKLPTFDARVWQVPTRAEGANVFLWREMDATRNSVTMAAQTVYSDKELFKKTCSQKQELLFQKGINWNDYPAFFKRGTYIQRQTVKTPFSPEDLAGLPPKHHAHSNPNLVIERHQFAVIHLPPLGQIENKEEVLFEGAAPVKKTDRPNP
jgi:tRNA(His) guanylyltransferase